MAMARHGEQYRVKVLCYSNDAGTLHPKKCTNLAAQGNTETYEETQTFDTIFSRRPRRRRKSKLLPVQSFMGNNKNEQLPRQKATENA